MRQNKKWKQILWTFSLIIITIIIILICCFFLLLLLSLLLLLNVYFANFNCHFSLVFTNRINNNNMKNKQMHICLLFIIINQTSLREKIHIENSTILNLSIIILLFDYLFLNFSLSLYLLRRNLFFCFCFLSDNLLFVCSFFCKNIFYFFNNLFIFSLISFLLYSMNQSINQSSFHFCAFVLFWWSLVCSLNIFFTQKNKFFYYYFGIE